MNILQERFNGVILKGKHLEDGECCILEYRSVKMGISWTDSPTLTRTFDIRALNDGPWSSDQLRTEWMLKLEEAVGGSLDWPQERQQIFIENVIIKTVQQIISQLSPNEKIKQQCINVKTLADAAYAAYAADAAAYAAYAAAYADAADAYAAAAAADAADAARAANAAYAAADAAYAAANAAAYAAAANAYAAARAADTILITACKIWIES